MYLNAAVSFTLGNRLNAFRDDFDIKALHASGQISTVTDYAFKDTGYILSATEVVDGNTVAKRIIVIVDETEYTLASNLITFVSPDIDSVTLELNGFKLPITTKAIALTLVVLSQKFTMKTLNMLELALSIAIVFKIPNTSKSLLVVQIWQHSTTMVAIISTSIWATIVKSKSHSHSLSNPSSK